LKEILKRASQGAVAAREVYRKLSRAQKVSLFLVAAFVGLALTSVALSGSDPDYVAVLTDEGGAGARKLDDFAARLARESIPWREGTAPGGARAIEVPASTYRRARAIAGEPEGASPPGPDWPFAPGGFWESEAKLGEKIRDFNRRRIEQAILWNPKVQDARVVLSGGHAPRRVLDPAGRSSASVTVQLKSGVGELLQKEADAIRAMVESAFDLGPDRVSITDNFFRSYGSGGAGAGSGVQEAGERWRREIKDGITEYYANCFDEDEFHVFVIVHVSSEQSSIAREEFDPDRAITKAISTKFEREEGRGGGDGFVHGGLMAASAAAVEGAPRRVIRESTEEMTWMPRKQTVTQIPSGVLRGASVSVLIDLAALERVLRGEEMLRRPVALVRGEGVPWTLASVPPDEREALIAAFVDREEDMLRTLLSTAGESNVKVIVSSFARSGRERAEADAAPALYSAVPPGGPPAPQPRGGGWGAALVGAGILACLAACAVAIARRALLRSPPAGEDVAGEPAGDGRAVWSRHVLARRAPGPPGILRAVNEASLNVRERPEVAASVIRFWLSQDAQEGASRT
jgi:flagellar biosynthesis/type III secretory pathway M-ring protein FliF/YscJ